MKKRTWLIFWAHLSLIMSSGMAALSPRQYIVGEIQEETHRPIPASVAQYLDFVLLPIIGEKASFATYHLLPVAGQSDRWRLTIQTFGYLAPLIEDGTSTRPRFDILDPHLGHFH